MAESEKKRREWTGMERVLPPSQDKAALYTAIAIFFILFDLVTQGLALPRDAWEILMVSASNFAILGTLVVVFSVTCWAGFGTGDLRFFFESGTKEKWKAAAVMFSTLLAVIALRSAIAHFTSSLISNAVFSGALLSYVAWAFLVESPAREKS